MAGPPMLNQDPANVDASIYLLDFFNNRPGPLGRLSARSVFRSKYVLYLKVWHFLCACGVLSSPFRRISALAVPPATSPRL
jgi:hypothetical protein